MKKYYLLIFLTLSNLFASFEQVNISPLSLSIGKIIYMDSPSFYTPFSIDYQATGFINYSMPYSIEELSIENVGFGKSVYENFYLFASIRNFGHSNLYSEKSFLFAFSWSDLENIIITPTITYNYIASTYKNYSSISFGTSVLLKPNKSLHILLTANNFYGTQITDNENIASKYSSTLKYLITDNSAFYFEIAKDSKYNATIKTGLEYTPFTLFSLRTGYALDLQTVTGGFSFGYENYFFDYGMSYHFILGTTHALGFRFSL